MIFDMDLAAFLPDVLAEPDWPWAAPARNVPPESPTLTGSSSGTEITLEGTIDNT